MRSGTAAQAWHDEPTQAAMRITQVMTQTTTTLVIGAAGGLGRALAESFETRGPVIALSRRSSPTIDITDEASVEAAATYVAGQGMPLGLLVIATGFLHDEVNRPERSLRDLSASHFAKAFAINAMGPALVLKHFTPLLPREGRAVVAVLSAKVGSIGDNQLGGWHAYRASKAALNQIVRTASVELKRTRPGAICVALHPGTVDTKLSAPFSKSGLNVRPPEEAAADLLRVIEGLTPTQTGGFFDYTGKPLPW
jgi:NAD(P)-dependent dehydrogenase (short-subunit alcohol dehydrogenase family)